MKRRVVIGMLWCASLAVAYVAGFLVGSPLGTRDYVLMARDELLEQKAEESFRSYDNDIEMDADPDPILAGQPEFVAPIIQAAKRLQSPPILVDPQGNIELKAWRYSYNARGIIEVPGNRLNGRETALVVVHPWGIDDGQGWKTPEPAGAAAFSTPRKNSIFANHIAKVLRPFVDRMTPAVSLVLYTMLGDLDELRARAYPSIREDHFSPREREDARREIAERLKHYDYSGSDLPDEIKVSTSLPLKSYFRAFIGLDPSVRYNGEGFWELPVPVHSGLPVGEKTVVFYDFQGYRKLRNFLHSKGIRHVLIAGYSTDLCVRGSAGGYKNLEQDFNVFLVGDATMASFPAQIDPRYATSAAVAFASINRLVTETGWVRVLR